MGVRTVFVVGLLTVCGLLSAASAARCKGRRPVKLSLCQEFQLIRDLAPEDSVKRLIQSHMASDLRFRKAVQYMLSSDFKKTTAKIDATASFQNILSDFVAAGVDTSDIDSVGKIFDCVVIEYLRASTAESRSLPPAGSVAKQRSLNSFVQEVSRLISTNELLSTLRTQLAQNGQFAAFYEVMRDPAFRTKVMQGFVNSEIARPIKTLRRYQIDLPKLVDHAFNLLYLGPDV